MKATLLDCSTLYFTSNMKLFYLLGLLNGTALATVTTLENSFSYTPVPYETYLSAAPSKGNAISTSCISTQGVAFSDGGSGLTVSYTYTLKLTPEHISHCGWIDHLNLIDTRTLTYLGCSLQGSSSSLELWPNITVAMPGIGDYSFTKNMRQRTSRANLYEWIRNSGVLTMTVNYNNSPLAVPEGEYTLSCRIRLSSSGRELSEIKVDHSVSAYRTSPAPMGMAFTPNEIHVSTNGGSWNGTTVLEVNGQKGDSISFNSSVPVRVSLGDTWSEPGTLVTTSLSDSGLARGRVSIQGTSPSPGSHVVNLNAILQRE
ncbi:putative adhesin [Escherichia coli DEC10F]|nr:putative adhesin [Escherichia coli DEC10F]